LFIPNLLIYRHLNASELINIIEAVKMMLTRMLTLRNGLGLELCGLVASLFVKKTVLDVNLDLDIEVTRPSFREYSYKADS